MFSRRSTRSSFHGREEELACLLVVVRLLTQFYSVDFSQSKIGEKVCVQQMRFALAVFDGGLGHLA